MAFIDDLIKHDQEINMSKTNGISTLTLSRIAETWSEILQHEVSAYEAALCMAGVKLVEANVDPEDTGILDKAEVYIKLARSIFEP